MKIRFAGSTDVGRTRTHNEDNFFLLGEENLYVVADGMGGHACGEVASQLAVEALTNFFLDTGKDKELTWPYKADKSIAYQQSRFVNGIKLANRRVFEAAQAEARYRGMGTTIVSLLCSQEGTYMAHVGDSRGYLLRGDGSGFAQVTSDHSLLNDYMKVHAMTADEIAHFPHKNVIVRALGMKDTVAVEVQQLAVQPGDIVLLCSDGLSGMVTDEQLQAVLVAQRDDLEGACKELIAQANAKGGQDNITVVLVGFDA